MYYALDSDGAENVYMELEPGLNGHIGLGMGESWDVQRDQIDLPFRYTMSVVEGEQPILQAWFPGSHLMQQRMVDTLRAAGADNLQTFPAEVVREGTRDQVPGYVVANIVGRVSCANLSQSDARPLADVYYFNRLVIDPRRTNGLALFRVHESPMVVLVHEKIATALQRGNFLGLKLTAVAQTAPP